MSRISGIVEIAISNKHQANRMMCLDIRGLSSSILRPILSSEAGHFCEEFSSLAFSRASLKVSRR